jgi:hypothetical protein
MPVQFQQSVPIPRECSSAAKAAVSKTAIASSSLASPATFRTFCGGARRGYQARVEAEGLQGLAGTKDYASPASRRVEL